MGAQTHTRKPKARARKPEKRGQRQKLLELVVVERADNRGAKHVQTRPISWGYETRKESQLVGHKIPYLGRARRSSACPFKLLVKMDMLYWKGIGRSRTTTCCQEIKKKKKKNSNPN